MLETRIRPEAPDRFGSSVLVTVGLIVGFKSPPGDDTQMTYPTQREILAQPRPSSGFQDTICTQPCLEDEAIESQVSPFLTVYGVQTQSLGIQRDPDVGKLWQNASRLFAKMRRRVLMFFEVDTV
jgi:hypothetical protein